MHEETKHNRRFFLTAAALTIAAVQLGMLGCRAQQQSRPVAAHGIDVDEQGNGSITEQRLYQNNGFIR